MSELALAGLVATVCALVAWSQWLWFCAWLVRFTGSSESLKDAAIVARSFRAPRSSGDNSPAAAKPAEVGLRNEVLAALPAVRATGTEPFAQGDVVPAARTTKSAAASRRRQATGQGAARGDGAAEG